MESVEAIKVIEDLFSNYCDEVSVLYNEANCYTITFKENGNPFFINIQKSVFFNVRDLYGILTYRIIQSLNNYNANEDYENVLLCVLKEVTERVTKEIQDEQNDTMEQDVVEQRDILYHNEKLGTTGQIGDVE